MSGLLGIQDFCTQVMYAIAAVISTEVVVIDDDVNLIAGTGYYHDRIGGKVQDNSISHQILATGKTFFIPNPRDNEACLMCSQRATCPDLAELCLPINYKGKTIGVCILVALNERQRENLIAQYDSLMNFMARISEMLGLSIEARQLTNELADLAFEFETVINSVQEGIIAVDNEGKITQVNIAAENMLNKSENDLVDTYYANLFKDPFLMNAVNNKEVLDNQEIFADVSGKNKSYLANLTYIQGDETKGFVLVIRNISEVRKMIGAYFSTERSITFSDIIGESKAIKNVIEKARLVSSSSSTVLIQGESGTGKDVFARAIHFDSPRNAGPFIALNCGAIPEALLESEIFGYDEGAFTGAKRGGKIGKFELANHGTLFLDEIGDMPIHLQVKLLRVLEERVVTRLGGTREIPVDVKIIAATNKDLALLVKRDAFREDLYYRLNVIPIYIPPLRERTEDIGVLMQFFRYKFNKLLKKNIQGFSPEVEQALMKYQWPGNVRELENAIEYAVNIEPGSFIQSQSLPKQIRQKKESLDSEPLGQDNVIMQFKDMEKKMIIAALNLYGYSTVGKEKAAQALGTGKATLYRKIKEYGIHIRGPVVLK